MSFSLISFFAFFFLKDFFLSVLLFPYIYIYTSPLLFWTVSLALISPLNILGPRTWNLGTLPEGDGGKCEYKNLRIALHIWRYNPKFSNEKITLNTKRVSLIKHLHYIFLDDFTNWKMCTWNGEKGYFPQLWGFHIISSYLRPTTNAFSASISSSDHYSILQCTGVQGIKCKKAKTIQKGSMKKWSQNGSFWFKTYAYK